MPNVEAPFSTSRSISGASRIARPEHKPDHARVWNKLRREFETLRIKLIDEEIHPGGIASRVVDTCNHPYRTGSPPVMNTIGTVLVALCAAILAATPPLETSTVTSRSTSSAASTRKTFISSVLPSGTR